ncbi:MAG: TlpA family protein disulfide reductase, partial [Gaiellaceae bacterium]
LQALDNLYLYDEDDAPDVGDAAIASDTPTLSSTGEDTSSLTTRTPPDESLLRYSVAESLEAKVPFLVTFATPKYCTSRTCGPSVDVVEEAAQRFEDERVRFIHVEVYEGNDPAKGYNRWMQEWRLTTEPWTFVVGGDGRVVERFEGAVSVNELEESVRGVTGD